MKKKYAVTAGIAAAIALPASLLATAAPASADIDKAGTCAGARYELSVDKERGGFDIDAEIDGKPGSTWRMSLRHDGKLFYNTRRTADAEGELDVDRFRPNTAGQDGFRLTVTDLKSGTKCIARVVTR